MARLARWAGAGATCAIFCIPSAAISGSDGAVPPPRVVEHHQNAETRDVETVYRCSGSARRFSVRYHDREGSVRFVSGSRDRRKVSPSDIARTTNALRKLDSVTGFYPQCGAANDVLLAEGLIGKKKAFVSIVWAAEGLQPSLPQMLE